MQKKAGFKEEICVDTSYLAAKSDLVSLVCKLTQINYELVSKLSYAVDNDVVIKLTVYGKLAIKVNAIDTKVSSTSETDSKT